MTVIINNTDNNNLMMIAINFIITSILYNT